MEKNTVERNIAVAVILSLVTCGIYMIYWFVVLTNDVKTYSEDQDLPSGGICVLLTIITCGIYGVYWAYKIGELMKNAQEKNGLAIKDNSILYLVLELIGLGIIVTALVQSDLNEITRKKVGGTAQ